MARRTRRTLLSTLVILGEGACEKAFLSYLKDLYAKNNTAVHITSSTLW